MNFKHGVVQLFIAIDQLLNVLTNPFSLNTWADETLSSRCGRLGYRWPYKFYKAVIDGVLKYVTASTRSRRKKPGTTSRRACAEQRTRQRTKRHEHRRAM
jgi:hypothetical protein